MSSSAQSKRVFMLGAAVFTMAVLYLLTPKNQEFIESLDAIEFDEQALLERAYEDVRNAEELPPLELEDEQIIKIFDEDNQLIQSMTLMSGDEIADEDFRKLINQSTLLAEYRTSKIYQLNK